MFQRKTSPKKNEKSSQQKSVTSQPTSSTKSDLLISPKMDVTIHPQNDGNPKPSFLGGITRILGCKTLIFHGFGVQGKGHLKHPNGGHWEEPGPGDSTGTESVTLNVVAAETWSLGDRPAGPTAPLFGQGNSVDWVLGGQDSDLLWYVIYLIWFCNLYIHWTVMNLMIYFFY